MFACIFLPEVKNRCTFREDRPAHFLPQVATIDIWVETESSNHELVFEIPHAAIAAVPAPIEQH
jgi:hypothetical protein